MKAETFKTSREQFYLDVATPARLVIGVTEYIKENVTSVGKQTVVFWVVYMDFGSNFKAIKARIFITFTLNVTLQT